MPRVDPLDLGKESRDDYFWTDCRGTFFFGLLFGLAAVLLISGFDLSFCFGRVKTILILIVEHKHDFNVNLKPEQKSKLSSVLLKIRGIDQESWKQNVTGALGTRKPIRLGTGRKLLTSGATNRFGYFDNYIFALLTGYRDPPADVTIREYGTPAIEAQQRLRRGKTCQFYLGYANVLVINQWLLQLKYAFGFHSTQILVTAAVVISYVHVYTQFDMFRFETVYMNYAAYCGYITAITFLSALLKQDSRNGNDHTNTESFNWQEASTQAEEWLSEQKEWAEDFCAERNSGAVTVCKAIEHTWIILILLQAQMLMVDFRSSFKISSSSSINYASPFNCKMEKSSPDRASSVLNSIDSVGRNMDKINDFVGYSADQRLTSEADQNVVTRRASAGRVEAKQRLTKLDQRQSQD
ncbi:hypothetical protein L6452_01839 [Arctium lappa]|uniref:Uncharacterized protein n=1 Tax=Arctium lappa TaxID=4217 RepID=A0ACB9FIE7_ARCLA|nr:hypothetical protein L6452_01839 [Arctium lappa]